MTRECRHRPAHCQRCMALDLARQTLFEAGRKLSQAHAERLAGPKTPSASTWKKCREADRELQRAAVLYTAQLIADQAGNEQDTEPGELAERVAAAVAFIKGPE